MKHASRTVAPGPMERLRPLAIAALTLLMLGAYGGRHRAPPLSGAAADVAPRAPADTIPAATLALGERVFQGKVGGALCATCHGKNAKGVPGVGPDLTDATWLHGDGSRAFLAQVIRSGVMQPKQGGAMMPPFGGGTLNAEQLEAVAAYVWSLGH